MAESLAKLGGLSHMRDSWDQAEPWETAVAQAVQESDTRYFSPVR